MSWLVSKTVYNTVGYQVDGKNLELVEQCKQSWIDYPVLLTSTERETMNYHHVMLIMQKNLWQPSRMAGLNYNPLYSTLVHDLDSEFKNEMLWYETEMKLATEKDKQKIESLNNRNFWYYGGGILLGTCVGGPVGGGVGALVGGGIGLLGSSTSRGVYVRREGSMQRIKWLQSIDSFEKKRFGQMISKVQDAVIPLIDSLKELKEENQFNIDKLHQLRELGQLFRSIFPNLVLKGPDGESVDHLLSQYAQIK